MRPHALLRSLPNVLSLMRLLLALPLVFLPPRSAAFFAIYLFCGVSDVLDGWLARRLGVAGPSGARLDSAADFVFFMVVLIVLIRAFGGDLMGWLPVVLWIVLFRTTALIVTTVRTGGPLFIHTLANKAAGLAVFLLPPLLALGLRTEVIVPALALGLLSALEELVLVCRPGPLDPDRKSIFLPRQLAGARPREREPDRR
ncbi:CDP-alcohol phosphatidyltransferase family protein [Myxococcota bacterium]|nr:CDP-alcohol phosphatidyltransferase family protein [Myxococcota bacterium]MBU1510885.1 CDP-alcohol phosphatidyltransferase family protein [Myxococcota bacterium]